MKADSFRHPMTVAERVFGLVYLPVHAVGLPFLLLLLAELFRPQTDEIWLDLAMYAVGLLACLIFLHRFLKTSFSDIFDRPGRFVFTLLVCAVIYLGLNTLVNSLLLLAPAEVTENPNNEAVAAIAGSNFRVTVAITVFMAPILEECLFRGALFGTIRRKSRVTAYVVTILLFAFYHLWSMFVYAYDSSLWWYLLQYVPAGFALCYAYERSGTVWCPIVLHAAINALAMYAQTLG